jgi:hypothetical protein
MSTNHHTEESTMITIADYQERIGMAQLRTGDFLDYIEQGATVTKVGSRVTKFDAATGVLATVTVPQGVGLRAGQYTAVIRRRSA